MKQNVINYGIDISIKTKLWLAYSCLILAISVFIYIYFPSEYEKNAKISLKNKVDAIALMTAYNITSAIYFDDSLSINEAIEMAILNPDINCCVVFTSNCKVLASKSSGKHIKECSIGCNAVSEFNDELRLYHSVQNIEYNGVPLGKLILCANTVKLQNDVKQSKLSILIISIIIFLIGFVTVYIISYFISEPIKKMSNSLKVLAEGDFSKRSEIKSNDEVGKLAISFNTMAVKLESAYKELHHLNSNLENNVFERTKELQNEIKRRIDVEESLKLSETKLRKLSIHMEQLREEERKNLAEQIHDEIGQSLTALKIELNWVFDKVSDQNPEISERIENLFEIIDSAINLVRTISTELRPPILDDFGLNSTIRWLIEKNQQSSLIKFNFTSNLNEKELSKTQALITFRIIKEAITNILRHSNAKNVDIVFEEFFDYFRISIYDDGIGINEDSLKNPESFGLNTMKERAFALNGNIEFLSSEGNGTLIVIKFSKQ